MRPADAVVADLLAPAPGAAAAGHRVAETARVRSVSQPAAAAGSGAQPAGAAVCEMPVRRCGAAVVLLAGGPVRVPFRSCCAVALVQGLCGTSREAPELRP